MIKFGLFKNLLVSFTLVSLTACSFQRQTTIQIDTANLAQLESASFQARSANTTAFTYLRGKALRDSGMSIGAQGGLAWSSDQLNARLKQDVKYLDSIYNFNGMMLSHGVIPPVLEEGNNTLNLSDPTTIRVADRTYKIVKQARFATTPPNWREYLWLSFPKPELPDKSLLPRNAEEQRIWRDAVRAGWEKGVQQSYNIFQQNMAQLRRDYRGMILYRKLLQQKMISQPFVSRTELGVTGDGENMNVNDQVLRIVDLPQLQTDSRNWRAVVVKHE